MGFEVGAAVLGDALLADVATEAVVSAVIDTTIVDAVGTAGIGAFSGELAAGVGTMSAEAFATAYGAAPDLAATFAGAASSAVNTSVADIVAGAVATGGNYVADSIVADLALTSGAVASGTLTAAEIAQGIKLGVDAIGTVQKINSLGHSVGSVPTYRGGALPTGVQGFNPSGGYNLPVAGSMTAINPATGQAPATPELTPDNSIMLFGILGLGVLVLLFRSKK